MPLGKRLQEAILFLAGLAVTLSIFFRAQLLSGFQIAGSDRTDSIIQSSLLEHWYNVFRGISRWDTPNYFFPHQGTLGYNDGYFIYGIFHSLFRYLGADVLLSTELVNIVVKAFGFFGLYFLVSRMLKAPKGWGLFAAAFFSISNSTYLRGSHAQLYAVAFAPIFWILTWKFVDAVLNDRTLSRALLWGVSAAAFMSAWLLTAYYMAWFTIFFTASFGVLFLASNLKAVSQRLRLFGAREGIICCSVAMMAFIFLLPFFLVYLPKARETGMHALSWSMQYSPRIYDVFNVSPLNYLFGTPYVTAVKYLCATCEVDQVERMTGFSPIVIALLIVATGLFGFSRKSEDATFLRPLLWATLLTWAAILRVGEFSIWQFIFHYVPGAAAIRVPARFQIFLTAPCAILVTFAVRQWFSAAGARAILIFLLFLGELMVAKAGPPRAGQLSRLSVPAVPKDCKSFFVGPAEDQGEDKLYPHNVDAMMIAELIGISTINGFSSFNPPDWDFGDPLSSTYRSRVLGYVSKRQLSGVCELDLKGKRWMVIKENLNAR